MSVSEDLHSPLLIITHMPLLEDKDEEQERKAAAMLSLNIHDNYNYNEGQSIK